MYLVCVYLVMTSCDRDWRVYGVVPDSSFQSFKLKQKPKGTDKRQISSYDMQNCRFIHEQRQQKARWSYHSSVQQQKFLLFFKQFFSKDVSCYLVLCKWFCKMKIWKKSLLIFYLERAWFSILPNVKSLFKGVLICAKYEEEF